MKSTLRTGTIPGTVLDAERLHGVTGEEFIDKIFYVTDRIMLSQIREITGIDGTTLQNWVKRGWVDSPSKKTYSKEQLARILLINMMRDTLQLSHIMSLLKYMEGNDDEGKISECSLYDCVCKVLKAVSGANGGGINGLDDIIIEELTAFSDLPTEKKKRILVGVRIIVVSYYATTMKATAEYMLSAIGVDETEN